MSLPAYASAAELYRQAGWPAILPVPHEGKTPPPAGFTGADGRDTTISDIHGWAANGKGAYDVALRMPDGVIGIDIDQYVKHGRQKIGAETLAACEQRLGALPGTWSSTARGADQPSRIRFFRVPVGRYRTVIQPDIEIIQRHHRYAVVFPSVHEELHTQYVWYMPDGQPANRMPRPDELPWLPEAWVSFLREGAADAAPASAPPAAGEFLLARLNQDVRPACSVTYEAADRAVRVLDTATVGTRYDAMRDRVYRFVMEAAHGHAGFGHAVTALRQRWAELTPGEQREQEFERMLTTAARKAVTAIGGVFDLPDPCLIPTGVVANARPQPMDGRSDEAGEPLTNELPPIPAEVSWPQVIGAEPFLPQTDHDQELATEVLQRVWPMTRRVADLKTAWVQRGLLQWELSSDLSNRAVSEAAARMPLGDAKKCAPGEEPSPAQLHHKRRVRLLSNKGRGAVASTMKALTDGGRHPASVRLVDLDREPDVLWAGGVAWDLRRSIEVPTVAAHIDPNAVHLVSAGVAPALVPTPYWDAFLAAVWPDPEVRFWSLRVLSIGVTGYSDAALPILFGEGGTGKSSVISLLMSVLGSYACAADHRLISGEPAHASIVMALKGVRLAAVDEAMREGRWAQERLKQLTGGAPLTGNAMNQNPVTFDPTHTFALTSNVEPALSDEAMRRRVRLLPCHGDPDAVRDGRERCTGATWLTEAPGVLAQMMREAGLWLADRTTALTSAAPESIQLSMSEMARSQDLVGRWRAEATVDHDHGTASRQLYAGFRQWCKDGGTPVSAIPSETTWGKSLTKAGYPSINRGDARYRALLIQGSGGFTPTSGPVAPLAGQMAGTGGSLAGQFAAPASPDNPSSGPVFESQMAGLAGQLPISSHHSTTTPKTSQNGQDDPPTHVLTQTGGVNPPTRQKAEAKQGLISGLAGQEYPSDVDLQPARPVNELITLDPSRKVTASEVAQVATARDISKAQARELIKVETRQLAVERAEGPAVALPAAVDRAGTITPLTYDDARARVAAARARSTALTVDVETSGYPLGHRLYRLRLVQLGDAHEVVVFDAAADASVIRELLAGEHPLHAHSATADLAPLSHAGLIDPEQAWARMHDTVIPAKLADPSSTGADPALKKLSPAMLGEASTTMRADAARREVWKAAGWLVDTDADTPIERNGWAQIRHDSTTMIRYAGSDVLDTAAIALKLADQLPAPHIYERERLTEAMTARVSHRGLALDVDHIRALEVKHTAAQAQAAEWIRAQGIDNPGSGPQVAAKLAELGAELPRTKPSTKHPDGQPSTAEGALDPIAQETGPAAELAQRLLAYREHTTALGLFLRPYKALCEHGDGRARPTVYTLGTNTGRMSAVRPNIQQLPRSGGFRAMVNADPGQLMISADFSGVELRVAAALSGDPELTRIIADDRDLHMEVARLVWGPDATKAHRYKAKGIDFGYLYGGGVPTLAAQAGVSHEIAQRAVDVLKTMMPTLAKWSDWMQNKVKAGETQFPTYSGRIIHLPVTRPHAAGNYGIQGTARELLVDALVKWSQTKWGNSTLVPVHDELLCFVPEAEAEEATRVLVQCMETELNGVRIVAEADPPSFTWQDSA